jgi:hypothetical protein
MCLTWLEEVFGGVNSNTVLDLTVLFRCQGPVFGGVNSNTVLDLTVGQGQVTGPVRLLGSPCATVMAAAMTVGQG